MVVKVENDIGAGKKMVYGGCKRLFSYSSLQNVKCGWGLGSNWYEEKRKRRK